MCATCPAAKIFQNGLAVRENDTHLEMDVRNLVEGEQIVDVGPKTVEHYPRIISSAGTVFISGPVGNFEMEGFDVGTRDLLRTVSKSMATTIVSGGHLTAALKNTALMRTSIMSALRAGLWCCILPEPNCT